MSDKKKKKESGSISHRERLLKRVTVKNKRDAVAAAGSVVDGIGSISNNVALENVCRVLLWIDRDNTKMREFFKTERGAMRGAIDLDAEIISGMNLDVNQLREKLFAIELENTKLKKSEANFAQERAKLCSEIDDKNKQLSSVSSRVLGVLSTHLCEAHLCEMHLEEAKKLSVGEFIDREARRGCGECAASFDRKCLNDAHDANSHLRKDNADLRDRIDNEVRMFLKVEAELNAMEIEFKKLKNSGATSRLKKCGFCGHEHSALRRFEMGADGSAVEGWGECHANIRLTKIANAVKDLRDFISCKGGYPYKEGLISRLEEIQKM